MGDPKTKVNKGNILYAMTAVPYSCKSLKQRESEYSCQVLFGSRYSRMDQVKFVEDSL